jgi:SH3-like domain-containing protein
MRVLLVLLGFFTAAAPALAQSCDTPSGFPVPRFVTLAYDEAAGRAGPSGDHPISWMYVRRGLPVEVIAETPDWRRVRDPGGEVVWMHKRLLSGRRALWAQEPADLRARPDDEASLIARIEPGARLWLERCRGGWCRLEADGRRGWAEARLFWGAYGEEAEPSLDLEGDMDPCYRSEPVRARASTASDEASPAR